MGNDKAAAVATWRSWVISIAAAVLLSLAAGWFLGAVFHGGAGHAGHGGGAPASGPACVGGCCVEGVKR
jgi:hypothetical protein